MQIFEEVMAQTSRKPEGFVQMLERRNSGRQPTLRSRSGTMTSTQWELELLPPRALERLKAAIDALACNALEPNIFFESSVLASAWPRLTSLLAPGGVWIACLWEEVGDEKTLRLIMPIRRTTYGFAKKPVLQVLSNEYMPIGSPLIDRDCADEACEMLLQLIADPELGLPSILDFRYLPRDGAFHSILMGAAKAAALPTRSTLAHQRAALFSGHQADGFFAATLGKKSHRELARQLNRLTENGQTEFVRARSTDNVLDAFESFMVLELKGWKGRRGTALYNHKRIAAFSRQIVVELALAKACEILLLKHQGQAIAALILLGRDGVFVPWKMAFDERMAKYSPGMQVMADATLTLLNRDGFRQADSLAVADHWMMNRTWPDRLDIVDVAVGLRRENTHQLRNYGDSKQRAAFLKSHLRKLTDPFRARH